MLARQFAECIWGKKCEEFNEKFQVEVMVTISLHITYMMVIVIVTSKKAMSKYL